MSTWSTVDESGQWPFLDRNAELDVHEHHLPHWQQGRALCFVTWRLGDALPQEKLRQWQEEKRLWLKRNPKPWKPTTREEYRNLFPRRIEQWLDAGKGECLLRTPVNGDIVASAILHFNHDRYDISSFVVMPNHVHVLFQTRSDHSLDAIIKSWKGYSARIINLTLGRSGQLWQEDYWDRLLRSPDHLERCLDYIRRNPEFGGLRHGEFILHEDSSYIDQLRPWLNDGDDESTDG